jgi:hypothetical protein
LKIDVSTMCSKSVSNYQLLLCNCRANVLSETEGKSVCEVQIRSSTHWSLPGPRRWQLEGNASIECCEKWLEALDEPHPEFATGGEGADPEAVHNLCLILKIMLQKSCCKHNITLPAAAFIYTRI